MAAGDLCTLAEVREHMQMPTAETEQDAVIQSLITRLSLAIKGYTSREFATTLTSPPNTRRLTVRPRRYRDGAYIVPLAPYDLQSATTVKLHPETASPVTLVAGTDYVLEPVDLPEGVYTEIRLSGALGVGSSTTAMRFGYAYLDVTGTWGFASVPADVKEACILAVSMHLREDVQGFGSALQPNSFGEGLNQPLALPPGIRGLLDRYRGVLVA